MRVRRLFWVLVPVLLVGGAQYGLQRYASIELDGALVKMRSWANVAVGERFFWLWGVADVYDVNITPRISVDRQYGLPPGYSVAIRHLHLHNLRLGWDGRPVLISADMNIRGLRLRLPEWRWAITVARDANGKKLRAPTMRSMGFSVLSFDLDMRARFPQTYSQPNTDVMGRAKGLGGLHLNCALDVPRSAIRNPFGIAVRRCQIDYQDLGLVRHFEMQMAHVNHISVGVLRSAIGAQVARDAERARWPLLNAQAVQEFVREPDRILKLKMAPARPLPLSSIPHNIGRGLPAYLGLTAQVQVQSAHSSKPH